MLLRNASNFPGHKGMRGHVLAVRSPSPASLAQVVPPHRLEELVEDMQVGNAVCSVMLQCGEKNSTGIVS
jgi:hypothetical protein